jgi:PEP-CTERM motif
MTRLRLCLLMLLSAVGFAAGPAQAALTQFTFTGFCTDACTGEGIAVLTLQDYTLGTPLTASDFVSFSYESKQNSFSVDSTELQKISGALPAVLPSSASVSIVVGAKDEIFMSSTGGNGGWFAGPKGSVDAGLFSSWSAGAVPEPSTWAMLLIGFGGVGYAGYRRARITPRAA